MDNNFIEVPEPMFKYNGEQIIHDDNLAIMSTFEGATILDKDLVKALKAELQQLNQTLKDAHVSFYLKKLDALKQSYNSLRIDYEQLVAASKELAAIYKAEPHLILYIWILFQSVCNEIETIKDDVPRFKHRIARLNKKLKSYRPMLLRRQEIHQQLKSHYAAIEDEKKEKLLQQGMAEEAGIIAQQMRSTLSRLNFAHRYTVGNKTKVDLVDFDYVVATPDQLQFKIKASKQGLWGGSIDMLPQGVFVTELIQPKIMNELSAPLEREVWSPHTSDEQVPLINGAWIIVERLGLFEGIPKHVTYKQLMERYETANHDKFPIPAGLKRGRRINWVELASPSGVHMMFTGITHSGKSNAMRAMVSALIEKQSPADINFVFVDLKKQGDFSEFGTAPHCIRFDGKGVLEEIDDVVSVLQQVRAELHMRQKRIKSVAKNLSDYNKRVQPEHRMPRIVIVFDEYANTRRTRFDEQSTIIDDICIEIGQVARASGISLWIGIQQPRRDNMPSSLRDNITTQFIGHQSNVGAAQSVTGNRESLKLEDFPGRMNANIGWKSEKVQMPYISEDEVQLAVQIAIDNYGETNPYQLVSIDDTDNYKPISNEQIILDLALDEFNGNLKIYPMHDVLKGQMSRNEIKTIINSLAEQQTVLYQNQLYHVEKQSGNYYALIPVDNEITESQAHHISAN